MQLMGHKKRCLVTEWVPLLQQWSTCIVYTSCMKSVPELSQMWERDYIWEMKLTVPSLRRGRTLDPSVAIITSVLESCVNLMMCMIYHLCWGWGWFDSSVLFISLSINVLSLLPNNPPNLFWICVSYSLFDWFCSNFLATSYCLPGGVCVDFVSSSMLAWTSADGRHSDTM